MAAEVELLGEVGTVLVDSAWFVHPAETPPIARRIAKANPVLTSRVSALREALGSSADVDSGNEGAAGDLVPEVARAVPRVLAGIADGLAHDPHPGAVHKRLRGDAWCCIARCVALFDPAAAALIASSGDGSHPHRRAHRCGGLGIGPRRGRWRQDRLGDGLR